MSFGQSVTPTTQRNSYFVEGRQILDDVLRSLWAYVVDGSVSVSTYSASIICDHIYLFFPNDSTLTLLLLQLLRKQRKTPTVALKTFLFSLLRRFNMSDHPSLILLPMNLVPLPLSVKELLRLSLKFETSSSDSAEFRFRELTSEIFGLATTVDAPDGIVGFDTWSHRNVLFRFMEKVRDGLLMRLFHSPEVCHPFTLHLS